MAIDLEFVKIMNELRAINRLRPDLRFGALLQEAVDRKRGIKNFNMFDITSKQLRLALEDYHNRLKNKEDES